MTIRQLTNEEKTITTKAISRLNLDKEYQEYQLKYVKLMLDEGLQQNLRQAMKEFNKKKQDHVQELNQIEMNIKILNDQIKKGVEVKEPVKEEKEEEE